MQPNTQHQRQRASQPGPVADLAAHREARAERPGREARPGRATEAADAAARPDPGTSSILAVMYEAGLAEGERRAYEAMGVRRAPQPSRAPVRLLAAVPETELEAEP